MKKLLQSNWLLALLGGVLYMGTTFGVLVSSVSSLSTQPSTDHHDEQELAHLLGPSWEYVNPEINNLVLELQAREVAIQQKEEELKSWEQQIEKEYSLIRGITNRVQLVQQQVGSSKSDTTVADAASLKPLLDLLKTMPPAQTTALLDPMTDEKVARILRMLKPSEVGPIVQQWMSEGGSSMERVHRILREYEAQASEKQDIGSEPKS